MLQTDIISINLKEKIIQLIKLSNKSTIFNYLVKKS